MQNGSGHLMGLPLPSAGALSLLVSMMLGDAIFTGSAINVIEGDDEEEARVTGKWRTLVDRLSSFG